MASLNRGVSGTDFRNAHADERVIYRKIIFFKNNYKILNWIFNLFIFLQETLLEHDSEPDEDMIFK